MTKNKKNPTHKMFCNYPDALTLTDFANMLGISTKPALLIVVLTVASRMPKSVWRATAIIS